jgi:hypothetical protein
LNNEVIQIGALQSGDKVLRLSTAYGMVTETLNWLEGTAGVVNIVVTVDFPVADKTQIIEAVRKAVTDNPDVKLAIFSHISSMVSREQDNLVS